MQNTDGISFLNELESGSVNLVLTDPPYITSRKSGMDEHAKKVKELDESSEYIKSEEEWNAFKSEAEWELWFDKGNVPKKQQAKKMVTLKHNFMTYGTIYGKKYAVVTDYGDWDSNFTLELLETFVEHYFRVLKNGGTAIIFFDIWKISELKEIMEKVGFKQIRFIEWIKTNPQPLNSQRNYLTNCREIALCGIKKSKPTFNSKYDNGIYTFPLQGGKNRFHPTQKSLALFEELIKKHSNENDIILDTFLGSGTTARAAQNTKRICQGCEVSQEYFDKMMKLID